MKAFVTIFLLLSALSSFAMTRGEAEKLLQAKNLSLTALEGKGWKLLPGETTGHGRIAFTKVQAIFTAEQAILKNEIESISFNGQEIFSSLESLRCDGQYVLREEVRGLMVLE